jgi:transcriptional regulator with XRE-family HTH domain
MDLKTFLETEKKGLSFRALEKRAGELDHAYIWHLVKGSKESPSEATVQKLAQALQLDVRQSQVLGQLAKGPVDDALCDLMLQRTDIPWDDFVPVMTTSLRGQRPTTQADWLKLIDFIRDL